MQIDTRSLPLAEINSTNAPPPPQTSTSINDTPPPYSKGDKLPDDGVSDVPQSEQQTSMSPLNAKQIRKKSVITEIVGGIVAAVIAAATRRNHCRRHHCMGSRLVGALLQGGRSCEGDHLSADYGVWNGGANSIMGNEGDEQAFRAASKCRYRGHRRRGCRRSC
ncbi:hypothetical protein JCM3765_003769 [Sporobolomyces pararoseus]